MVGSSRIFIDGGDPAETKTAHERLQSAGHGGLDGQTTNPTLIAKNALKSLEAKDTAGGKLSEEEAFAFYRQTVETMSEIIPKGEISIQVIGDPAYLSTENMLHQARDRILWIPNAVIKFPTTKEGLGAAEAFCQEGPINMTLNFSQEQAAAIYAATKAHNYAVYVSPFVGRLDDRGENGMDIVANIAEMYRGLGDQHVQVLTASVRNRKHLDYALFLKSDVITIPFGVFTEWADAGFSIPSEDFIYDVPGLSEIPYRELTLDESWQSYDISHDLTEKGVNSFWTDWQKIVTTSSS